MGHRCRQRHNMGLQWKLPLAATCSLLFFAMSVLGSNANKPPSAADMERWVAVASQVNPSWDGPRSGPAGVSGKTIAMVCEDLRNGGILGVAQGIQEAVLGAVGEFAGDPPQPRHDDLTLMILVRDGL